MTDKQQSTLSVTTEQAGEQMPMPARLRTKDTRWRCCRKHTGVPRNSASLPKPAGKKLWRMEEEKRPVCDPTTLRPLQRAIPSSLCLPPFIDPEGSRFPSLTILPNESNYLGSLCT